MSSLQPGHDGVPPSRPADVSASVSSASSSTTAAASTSAHPAPVASAPEAVQLWNPAFITWCTRTVTLRTWRRMKSLPSFCSRNHLLILPPTPPQSSVPAIVPIPRSLIASVSMSQHFLRPLSRQQPRSRRRMTPTARSRMTRRHGRSCERPASTQTMFTPLGLTWREHGLDGPILPR